MLAAGVPGHGVAHVHEGGEGLGGVGPHLGPGQAGALWQGVLGLDGVVALADAVARPGLVVHTDLLCNNWW